VQAVERDLGGPIGASVAAASQARSNLVVVRVQAADARRAALVANAVARQTRVVLTRQFRRDIGAQLRAARPELSQLRNNPDPTVRAEELRFRGRMRALRRLGRPVEVAREATIPSQQLSPRPVRNTLLGLIAGLTLGLIAAFLRDALDRRLRDSGEVAEAAALPVLGRVRDSSLGRLGIADPSRNGSVDEELEAVRILRANLDFLDVDRRGDRVLVTSALPEEGKSTVATGLAVATALSGRRTLLVECDLRRPVLAARLRLEASPGLSDHLAGHATPEEILQPVRLPGAGGAANGNGNGPTGGGELFCITAGSPAPRPAELLGSRRFADLLGTLARAFDSVVIDSSPLLPVVDTLELVPHVDRVVVCARARRTTRDQLRAAREALDRLPAPPAGIMLTGVRRGEEQDYGYYSYAGAARPTGRARGS
jgi:capsular exopolysaccharide synthesis family protein